MIDRLELAMPAAAILIAFMVLRHRRLPWRGWITVSVLVGLVALGWGSAVVLRVQEAESRRASLARKLPADRTDGEYVSSSACRACHPSEYASWHGTYHRTMTQRATPAAVVGDFDDVTLRWAGRTYHLQRRGDEFWVEMVDPTFEWDVMGGKRTPLPPGADPPRVWRQVVMTTGSHHQQVYWTPGIKPRQLDYFPFLWLIEEKRWVPRREAFLKDPDVEEGLVLWNYTCIQCHATGGQPGAQDDLRTWDTKRGELGIACEACHGPGHAHVAANRDPLRRYAQHFGEERDTTIFNPATDPERGSQACGQCHGIGFRPSMPRFYREGLRFRPGDDIQATEPVVFPARQSSASHVATLTKNDPEFLDGHFWKDGMVRVSGREFNGTAESPCYKRGKLSCMSCHSMHASDPNDQLAAGMESDQACLQCHTEFRTKIAEHSHHPTGSAGARCYNCHMPHTTYGLLKAIRSHQIDSPTVRATVETGRPNACNLCHLDQTLAWTQDWLAKWYGTPPVALGADEKKFAAGALWAVKGDAGQRALAAWSFGWPPAQDASRPGWQVPILTGLLEDRYSAVRFIAHRSLRAQKGFADFRYDFVGVPEERRAAAARALEGWAATVGRVSDNVAVLLKPDGSRDPDAHAKLRSRRKERKMDLRE